MCLCPTSSPSSLCSARTVPLWCLRLVMMLAVEGRLRPLGLEVSPSGKCRRVPTASRIGRLSHQPGASHSFKIAGKITGPQVGPVTLPANCIFDGNIVLVILIRALYQDHSWLVEQGLQDCQPDRTQCLAKVPIPQGAEASNGRPSGRGCSALCVTINTHIAPSGRLLG